jgi:hypothetical protein
MLTTFKIAVVSGLSLAQMAIALGALVGVLAGKVLGSADRRSGD